MAAYDDLMGFVTDSGVPRSEAEHAVRQCVWAMVKYGAASYYGAGAIAIFMSMTIPSGVAFATYAAGAGAVAGFARAPQCAEIRERLRFWQTAPI